jgi:hypothetical protein
VCWLIYKVLCGQGPSVIDTIRFQAENDYMFHVSVFFFLQLLCVLPITDRQ